MSRTPDKYIADMLDACRFVASFTANESVERYRQDRAFRSAIERELQNDGEAMVQLRSLDPALVERIPEHRRIIGFRHVLVHGYDSIDDEVVWYIVQMKVPELVEALEMISSESE